MLKLIRLFMVKRKKINPSVFWNARYRYGARIVCFLHKSLLPHIIPASLFYFPRRSLYMGMVLIKCNRFWKFKQKYFLILLEGYGACAGVFAPPIKLQWSFAKKSH